MLKQVCFLIVFQIISLKVSSINIKPDTVIINTYINFAENNISTYSDSSIFVLKTAMTMSSQIDYQKGITSAGFLLSRIYKQKGLYYDAVKTVNYLMDYASKKHDNLLQGRCLLTIGEIHRAAFYIDKSLETLFEALKIFNDINNLDEKSRCYNRIAAVYFEKKDFRNSEYYADSSSQIAIKTNNYLLLANNEEILGAVYRRLQKRTEAIKKLDNAVYWTRKSGDTTDIANIYNNYAYTYLEMNSFDKAIEYAKKALTISKKQDILVYGTNSAQILSYCYGAKKDLIKAFDFLRYRDSLFNISLIKDREKIIMDLNEKYEESQKEKERLFLQKENDVKSITIRNQNYLFLISFITLLVVTIGLIIIYLGRKKLAAANKNLEIKSAQISKQNTQITDAYNKLKELETFKNDLTSMIVHDLKNPLNGIINPPSIYTDNKLQDYIRQTGLQMLTLVSNILDVQKNEESKLNLTLDVLNIHEHIKLISEQVKFLCEQKNLKIDFSIYENSFVKADIDLFDRIIINLLTNAIKFSPNNGTIQIKSELIADSVKISISDEGEGIPFDSQEIIFSKFGQIISKKSGISRSTGLGLTFCKMAVESHGGEIGFLSDPKRGSTFWFILPNAIINQNINALTTENSSQDLNFEYISLFINQTKLEKLRTLNIFEVTKIKYELNDIGDNANAEVKLWKEKLLNAVYSGNDKLYINILNNIKKGAHSKRTTDL